MEKIAKWCPFIITFAEKATTSVPISCSSILQTSWTPVRVDGHHGSPVSLGTVDENVAGVTVMGSY